MILNTLCKCFLFKPNIFSKKVDRRGTQPQLYIEIAPLKQVVLWNSISSSTKHTRDWGKYEEVGVNRKNLHSNEEAKTSLMPKNASALWQQLYLAWVQTRKISKTRQFRKMRMRMCTRPAEQQIALTSGIQQIGSWLWPIQLVLSLQHVQQHSLGIVLYIQTHVYSMWEYVGMPRVRTTWNHSSSRKPTTKRPTYKLSAQRWHLLNGSIEKLIGNSKSDIVSFSFSCTRRAYGAGLVRGKCR